MSAARTDAPDTGDALLRAGMAPVDSEEGEPVRARGYRHPALGGRPVVRLVAERLGEAEDRTLGFLGFTAPTVSPPVARGVTGGVGYPAWALINDPANGRLALSVIPDMEFAARKAVASPSTAHLTLLDVADRLPAGHLPAFWEEAGRIFLRADRSHYTVQYFGKAREAERRHALPVDEATLQAVYLEFALAGALSVKALTEYLDELSRRYAPDEALAKFESLAFGRIRAGLAPWSTMHAQWRRLVKATGRDADAEARRLLTELFDAPALRYAPVKFWEVFRPALVALGRSDERHARTILHLFPRYSDNDRDAHTFTTWWLELLDEIGAFRLLDDPGHARSWLHRMIGQLKVSDRRDSAPPRLLALVEELAPRLTGVDLSAGTDWYVNRVNIDLLSTFLRLGVPVADPVKNARLDVTDWIATARTDLAPVVTDPRFRELLYTELDRLAVGPETLRHRRLRPVVGGWLVDRATRAEGGGLLDLEASMKLFEHISLDEQPEARRALADMDPVERLRRSLRAGTPAELGWPAFDEAVSELGGRVEMIPSWPILTVYNGVKAIAVGPEGRVAEHALQTSAGPDRTVVAYADGAFIVAWKAGREYHHYWSHDPSRVAPLANSWLSTHIQGMGFTPLTSDGTRLTEGTALRRGDDRINDNDDVLSDGERFWIGQWESGSVRFREVDPQTGKVGGHSTPAFFDDAALPDGHWWLVHVNSLAALPEAVAAESPLGHDGGLVGFRASANGKTTVITGVDGRTATLPSDRDSPWGLLDIPGHDTPRIMTGTGFVNLIGPDGALHWAVATGTATTPPAAFWHFTSPRDPEGSKALRDVDTPTVERLVTALTEDRAAVDSGAEPKGTTARTDAVLTDIGIRHPVLREAVTDMTRRAVGLRDQRERLLSAGRSTVGRPPAIDRTGLAEGLSGLVTSGRPAQYDRTADQLTAQLDFLAERIDGPTTLAALRYHSTDWTPLLGNLAALAVRAVSVAYDDTVRDTLRRLLGLLADGPATTGVLRRGTMVTGGAVAHRDPGGALVTVDSVYRDGQRHHRFIELGDPRRPATATAVHTVPVGWGSPDRIAEFLAAAERRPVVPPDPKAVAILSERTGLNGSAALLLLTGLPGIEVYESDFLGPEGRERLGLKTTTAKAGRMAFDGMTRGDRLALYEAALGEDATVLWDPPRFAARLADAWVARYGRRIPLSEEVILAADRLELHNGTESVLRYLTEVGREPDAEAPAAAPPLGDADGLLTVMELLDLRRVVSWAYTALPEGDPVRDGVPRVREAVLASLADDRPLWDIGGHSAARFPRELLGDEPYWDQALGRKVHDGGLFVAVEEQDWFRVYFRPARLTDDAAGATLRALDDMHYTTLIDWWRGPDPVALAARIGSLPPGRYECDPRASVPELVDEVRSTLDLSEDAATLYLQLLTLLDPTDRHVRTWNDWTPARHKKAVAALLEAELVVAAKRSRAGRDVFLPGGWGTAKAPEVPSETWKDPMYPVFDSIPRSVTRPLPELFAHAWRRHTSGEGPR
ncbi:hypothetical protein LX16_4243 [Stackebrandtia albiflava]|uniref:DNA-binding protein n=1 Tax=Stackebrandtia albiflava TaxID=406432 RepID=A0A562UYY0_9ACTN|nr:hypothetical protein [Stackebrandtia albiflava]TWJ10819.1 hypothetical protein LX16_4243 [Stackebrandtia albiflava]